MGEVIYMSKYAKQYPIGTIVGSWIVIGSPVADKRGRPKIPVRCICGNETEVYAYHLLKGKTTRCKKCAIGKSPTEYGLAGRTKREWVFNSNLSSTLYTNTNYTINAVDLSQSFSNQNGECAISGEPLTWSNTSVVCYDRDKGFVPDNICLVSKTTSDIMNEMTVQEFSSFCEHAIENIKKNNPTEDFLNKREKNNE